MQQQNKTWKMALVRRTMITAFAFILPIGGWSATFYVDAARGSDNNTSTQAQSTNTPWKTIQKAADNAQAGDLILIRSGTYRECIKPPRGGSSESARITYKAYSGEHPVVTGSERMTTWASQGNGVWKLDVADALFGPYNPYVLTFGSFTSEWCRTTNVHPGEVFLNDSALLETSGLYFVQTTPRRWWPSHAGTTTTIYANFGSANPNTETAEINVRQNVFVPSVNGLAYITIDGLTMKQAASRWTEPNSSQDGMINTLWGKAWIIQNCWIYYAKTVGICSGNTPGTSRSNIETYGHHIVRNNLIEKCGETGIAGQYGWVASTIENNIIQDINYQDNISGMELAGIKVHFAIDLLIKGNIIRRAKHGPNASSMYGIWLDYSNQGCRVTGNIIYDISIEVMFIEASHGPNLIDNNIFIGKNLESNSSRNVYAHNLFYQSNYLWWNETRSSSYYQPHTMTSMGSGASTPIYIKNYNNIYMSVSPGANTYTPNMDEMQGYAGGGNVYYNWLQFLGVNAESSSSQRNGFAPTLLATNMPNGVRIAFSADALPRTVVCTPVTRSFIGVFSPMNQGIETHEGVAISITTDITGATRSASDPTAGPFESLQAGANSYVFTAGPSTIPTATAPHRQKKTGLDRTIGATLYGTALRIGPFDAHQRVMFFNVNGTLVTSAVSDQHGFCLLNKQSQTSGKIIIAKAGSANNMVAEKLIVN